MVGRARRGGGARAGPARLKRTPAGRSRAAAGRAASAGWSSPGGTSTTTRGRPGVRLRTSGASRRVPQLLSGGGTSAPPTDPSTPSRMPVDPVGDHPASRVADRTVRPDPAVGDRCAVSEHGARHHLQCGTFVPSRALSVPHRCERGGPQGTAVLGRRAGRVTTRRWPRRSGRNPDRPRGRSSRWRHPLRRASPLPRRYSTDAGQRSASRPSARWLTPGGVRPSLGRHVPASASAGLSPPPAPGRSCTELLGVRSGIRRPFPTGTSDRRSVSWAVSRSGPQVTGCPPLIPRLSPDPARLRAHLALLSARSDAFTRRRRMVAAPGSGTMAQ